MEVQHLLTAILSAGYVSLSWIIEYNMSPQLNSLPDKNWWLQMMPHHRKCLTLESQIPSPRPSQQSHLGSPLRVFIVTLQVHRTQYPLHPSHFGSSSISCGKSSPRHKHPHSSSIRPAHVLLQRYIRHALGPGVHFEEMLRRVGLIPFDPFILRNMMFVLKYFNSWNIKLVMGQWKMWSRSTEVLQFTSLGNSDGGGGIELGGTLFLSSKCIYLCINIFHSGCYELCPLLWNGFDKSFVFES